MSNPVQTAVNTQRSRPTVGVGVVVFRCDRVLLIKRAKPPRMGEWSLVGGKQEWGETVAETAAREVAEETGLRIGPPRLLTVLDLIEGTGPQDGVHFTLIDLVAEALDEGLSPGSDAADAAWFSEAAALRAVRWHETRRVLRLAFAQRAAGEV